MISEVHISCDLAMKESSVQHLIEKDLKWIFVGGKGGVGKTTTSCALGMILSRHKESVLIISTDPAHNLSDSLDQKFTNSPTLVKGFSNLYAMEIDSEASLGDCSVEISENQSFQLGQGILKDLMGTLPGIDEAMSFAKIAELVKSMKYSVVIFDTAPTGHTLKLLSFPISLSKTVSKLHEFKSSLFPLLKQMGSLFGSDFNLEPILNKIEAAIPIIEKVSAQLMDSASTTFVCVCIAEFLSMYETERLIQQLTTMNVNVNTIIINQLVEKNEACAQCELCTSRANSQQTYIEQIEEMYDGYHLIKSYLLPFEVRGMDRLKIYSKFLSE